MDLKSVISRPSSGAPALTIISEGGQGKTSLGALFPSPVFIRSEDGFDVFSGKKAPNAFPVLDKGIEIFEQLDALIEQDHPFKTLVIDSITSLDKRFENHIISSDPKGTNNIAKALGGYGAGISALAHLHSRVVKKCDILRKEKGMAVVYLGHAEPEPMDLPDEPSYIRYGIKMSKQSISFYTDFVSLVGLIKLQTVIDKNQQKAISFGDRVLIVGKRIYSITKNRYGIDDDIDLPRGENPLLDLIPFFKNKGNHENQNNDEDK